MSERDDLIRNLRQLVELDRASGVEFVTRNASPAGVEVRKPSQAEAPRIREVPVAAVVARPVPAAVAAPPARVAPEVRPPASAPAPQPPVTPAAPLVIPVTGLAASDLAAIATRIAACQRCKLCSGRTRTVPGEGNPSPELVFVGEGPGADEDAQGRPFVGAAGQLLTKMIEAMGFRRDEVFIANIVKCRPPNNRVPEPDEVAACLPYLEAQIQALRPKLICTLGNTPLRAMMGDEKLGITKMRGQQLAWKGFTLIPTFHPSFLLRNATAKKPCWEDLLAVLKALGRTPPPRRSA